MLFMNYWDCLHHLFTDNKMQRLLSDLINLVYRQDRLLTWWEIIGLLLAFGVMLSLLAWLGIDLTN